MPIPSAFAWVGALDCSSNPTHIEEFYELLPVLWGSEIDFTEVGSDDELQLYATSVVLGSALYEAEHAHNQAFPLSAYDLIPLLEQDYQLTPGPNDSVTTRQAAIAAAMKLPPGAAPAPVVNAIKALVGASNFYAYDPSPTAPTPTVYPTSPGTGPGQFKDVRTPVRFVQLVDPVVQVGVPVWCAYQNLDGTIVTPELLLKGDAIVVGAGNTAQMETVTVSATASAPPAGATPGYSYFQATFTKSHDIGAAITTGTFPYWWSTQRLAWIIVNQATATSRPVRAALDSLLAKTLRTVDQWAILYPTTTSGMKGTVGPFFIGAAMGTSPFGFYTFTFSM